MKNGSFHNEAVVKECYQQTARNQPVCFIVTDIPLNEDMKARVNI